MNILANLSNIIIPLLIFYIVAYGISAHVNVYDEFLEGARSGMQTVISIAPTMIGLMIAVGVLRASGFLDFDEQKGHDRSRNMDRTAGPDF